jgi:phage shock protein PspC (stress-responsive transcriptional regulator)
MTTTDTPTGPSAAPSPDLERPSLHAYRGVATALARTTGTDVLLWRVLFVVLTFFNGLGILLYLTGLATIPREGEAQSLAERLFRGPHRQLRRVDIVLVVLLVISIGHVVGHLDGALAVAVVAGLVFLVYRNRTGAPTDAPPLVRTAPEPVEPVAPVPPAPPAPRSVLGSLTLGLALLVVSTMALLNTTGVTDVHAEAIIASALVVVGGGIVASAWWGRSLLLIPVAVLLGLALAATSVARPAIDAGVGDRTWKPIGAADYHLGIGEATLDLRDVVVRESAITAITARVDVGHLVVIVPDDVRIAVHARADWGDVQVLGSDTDGRDATRDTTIGPEGRPQIRLDASVRTGQVEVRRG